MMRTPIHPTQKLPALPGGMDEILQQGSVEQWAKLCVSLGFELWHEMRGETLERHIQREAITQHDKMPRAKQPVVRPSLSSLRRTQLWLHPAGLVAVVNAYSREGEEWSVEPVTLMGCEEKGFTEPYSRLRRPDGSSTQALRWHSRSGLMSFENRWHDLQQVAAAGRLVPFSGWLEDIDNTFPFENALSWEGMHVSGALHNPSDRSKAHGRLLTLHWRKVAAHWEPKVALAPYGAGEVLARSLKKTLVLPRMGPGTYEKALPAVLAAWKKDVFLVKHDDEGLPGMALATALSELSPAVDWLCEEDRKRTTAWLTLASPSTPVSHVTSYLREHGLEQVAGSVSLLDVLLENPLVTGAMKKASHLVHGMSDAELSVRMTQEDARGATLGLKLALALMHIPQRRCEEIALKESQAQLLSLLTHVVQRVGPQSMVLHTQHRNVWEGALGMTFNAPIDEDLIGHHRPRVNAWIGWASEHGVVLPTQIVGRISEKPCPCLSVPGTADLATFEAAWVLAGGDDPVRQGNAQSRWNLLEPVRRHFRQSQLQDALVQPVSASPARLRM